MCIGGCLHPPPLGPSKGGGSALVRGATASHRVSRGRCGLVWCCIFAEAAPLCSTGAGKRARCMCCVCCYGCCDYWAWGCVEHGLRGLVLEAKKHRMLFLKPRLLRDNVLLFSRFVHVNSFRLIHSL